MTTIDLLSFNVVTIGDGRFVAPCTSRFIGRIKEGQNMIVGESVSLQIA